MGTKIDSKWWDKSITLVEGCTPVSEACKHCWSADMAHRFRPEYTTPGKPCYRFNGEIRCREDRLGEILKRKKPTRWAIWNDLFHPSVPFEFIDKVVDVFHKCPQHTGQILTKRAERMYEYSCSRYCMWPDNIIGMVTAENQKCADLRIPYLLQCGFKTTGVSCEPLLGEIDLKWQLTYPSQKCSSRIRNEQPPIGLDWVIVGGESGPKARPMHPDWARSIRDQCQAAGVPFFMKQRGEWLPGSQAAHLCDEELSKYKITGLTRNNVQAFFFKTSKKKAGHLLDGKEYREYPK